MTSAPMRSAASSNQIALPFDLCISSPLLVAQEGVAEEGLEGRLASNSVSRTMTVLMASRA